MERRIGTLRGELLDHLIVFHERSLHRHLRAFVDNYEPRSLGSGERCSAAPTDPAAGVWPHGLNAGAGWAASPIRTSRRLSHPTTHLYSSNCCSFRSPLVCDHTNDERTQACLSSHLTPAINETQFGVHGLKRHLSSTDSVAHFTPDAISEIDRLNELLPRRALAALRCRRDAMPLQDVPYRLIRDGIAEVGQRAHNSVVTQPEFPSPF